MRICSSCREISPADAVAAYLCSIRVSYCETQTERFAFMMLFMISLLAWLLPAASLAVLPPAGLPQPIADPVPNPLSANMMVTCDYGLGAGLEARSCFDALAHAPRSAQQEVWLPRQARPPSPPGTVISPTVVYSSELVILTLHQFSPFIQHWHTIVSPPLIRHLDDTNCAVWATLKQNFPLGQASSLNISQAAHAVIMNCVIPRRLGGWAQNIGMYLSPHRNIEFWRPKRSRVTSLGGDNKVTVLIKGSTTLQAQCGAPVARATERSCGYILDDMVKTADREDFGRPGYGPITVRTPSCKIAARCSSEKLIAISRLPSPSHFDLVSPSPITEYLSIMQLY